MRGLDVVIRPVAVAHTWLLRVGWRRHGLLPFARVEGAVRSARASGVAAAAGEHSRGA